MLNFSFRSWLEVERPKGQVLDPHFTALRWLSNTPEKADRINEEEGWKIVDAVSDKKVNDEVMAAYMAGVLQPGESRTVYNHPLMGYLLKIKPQEVGTSEFPQARELDFAMCAIYIPGGQTQTMFAFGGDETGPLSLYLIVPPLNRYSNQDKFGMWSAVIHESRHALDYAMGLMGRPTGLPEMFDAYANQIEEARAHSYQITRTLNALVEKANVKPERAIDLCEHLFVNNPVNEFRFAEETMPVVREYLKYLRQDTSLWLRQAKIEATEHPRSSTPIMRSENLILLVMPELRTIHKHIFAWLEAHKASNFVRACSACHTQHLQRPGKA